MHDAMNPYLSMQRPMPYFAASAVSSAESQASLRSGSEVPGVLAVVFAGARPHPATPMTRLRRTCTALWLGGLLSSAALAQTASPALVTPLDPAPPAASASATTGTPRPPQATGRAAAPSTPAAPAAPTTRTRKAAAPTPVAPERCLNGPDQAPYAERSDVLEWATKLAAQSPELDLQSLRRSLGQACYQPDVARLIMPPPPGQVRNWAAYRARFVEPQRIRAGLEFWSANQRWLAAAEARYGVPAEIIVGILGVETLYGRQVGRFRVLDALATLSFDFPTGRSDRSPYFREQLAALLRLANKEGLDPADFRGSYAGAIGWAQFMPGSWLSFAVDFNGDSRIDLRDSLPDVIGSIANFLAQHGWQSGMPVRYGVKPPADADQLATLLGPDIRPSFTRYELADAGAVLDAAGSEHSGLLALVELENGADRAPSYVAGTENFWALTRYNWSAYYAMAVLDLGASIAAQRGRSANRASALDDDDTASAKTRAGKARPKTKAGSSRK
ncbi:MAG: hypothetical protein RIQ60_138 [Pseudomonadota bacterium]|jgi:membrane-bound lytic murein transglycosylase B